MDRDCLIGVLEGYCRSLFGCGGPMVEPRCVRARNLGGSGGFRWVFGSNCHFWWVCCRFAMCVGWVLGIIVLSGGRLCLADFLALFIFVVLCTIVGDIELHCL